ncbi:MAG: hypothetical protein HY556_08780 [Euryarchaeota archaeon]|nr:hypothetical protein [Euryarchaeota archaeon]
MSTKGFLSGLICAVAVVTAGCVQSDVTADDASTSTISTSSASSHQSSGGTQVSVDAEGANVTVGNESTEAAAPQKVRKEEKLAFEGNTGVGACLPSGLGSCSGPGVPGTGNEWYLPKLTGRPVAAEVAMTWMATTPASDHLRLTVGAAYTCGQGGQCLDGVKTVGGPSPLIIKLEGLMLKEGQSLGFVVSTISMTPDPVYTFVDAGQDFMIAGTAIVESTS